LPSSVVAVREDFPTLRERALTLLVNLAVFYAAFFAATGRLLPTGNLESVWLISDVDPHSPVGTLVPTSTGIAALMNGDMVQAAQCWDDLLKD